MKKLPQRTSGDDDSQSRCRMLTYFSRGRDKKAILMGGCRQYPICICLSCSVVGGENT